MARIHTKGAVALVDEFDFSGEMNQVEIDIQNNPAPVTAFADTHETFVEGKRTFAVDFTGFWNTASNNFDGEMFTDLTTTGRALGIYPDEMTDGKFGWEGTSIPGPQERSAQIGGAILMSVNWKGDTGLIETTVLNRDTALSSTENGTAYQAGAVSATQKVFARVRLLAAPGGSGSNDLDITIESDNASGFSSATTRLTFTTLNQGSSATHEDQETNGAITDDWWRAVMTISGGGSRTFNILVTLGITLQ